MKLCKINLNSKALEVISQVSAVTKEEAEDISKTSAQIIKRETKNTKEMTAIRIKDTRINIFRRIITKITTINNIKIITKEKVAINTRIQKSNTKRKSFRTKISIAEAFQREILTLAKKLKSRISSLLKETSNTKIKTTSLIRNQLSNTDLKKWKISRLWVEVETVEATSP